MGIFNNFPDISLHFSSILGASIYNEDGKRFGTFCDFFVDYEEIYPLVLAIQYQQNGQLFYIPWNDLLEFSYKKIIIKNQAYIGRSRTFPRIKNIKKRDNLLSHQFDQDTIEYPPLGKMILDKQIVDTSGKKVVRVNDIQLIKSGNKLRVTHAEIGLRSMIRRIGLQAFVDFCIKTTHPKAKYLSSQTLINWKYVHTIPGRNMSRDIKIGLSNEDIKGLHPADLADILEDLDSHGRQIIFDNLDPKKAAETLSELDQELQSAFIDGNDPDRAALIIENMDTDDAADILNDLEESKADAIISKIQDDEIQEELQELLEHDEDSAGGLMSTEVFEVFSQATRTEIFQKIQETHDELETVYDIYVIDEEQKLIGSCSLRHLLIHESDVSIGNIMNKTDLKFLYPDSHWKEVATLMSKYDLINLPIVDKDHVLLGVVSVDDILPRLLNER